MYKLYLYIPNKKELNMQFKISLDKAKSLFLIFTSIFILFFQGLSQDSLRWYLPQTNTHDTIVHHLGYSLQYSREHKQATWVAYTVYEEKRIKNAEREDKFKADPLIKGTNFIKDYQKSGYDRGHLAPAADMSYRDTILKESFFFSNISPQIPAFNRGIWKSLEELIRDWGSDFDTLFILTGPILNDGLATIGANKISIPQAYFKVILAKKNQSSTIQGIAFILDNEGSKIPLQNFACKIDDVEKVTGIDFFPNLKDELELEIEAGICIDCWKW